MDDRTEQLERQPDVDTGGNIEAQVIKGGSSPKAVLTALAKFAVAGIILYWLYHKGAIQTARLAAALRGRGWNHPVRLLVARTALAGADESERHRAFDLACLLLFDGRQVLQPHYSRLFQRRFHTRYVCHPNA